MSADIHPRRRRFGGGAAVAIAAMAAVSMFAVTSLGGERPAEPDGSPLFGVEIPSGYRQWALIGVSNEAEPLIELRGILGNAVAFQAFRDGAQPFPDGTILVKLAWKRVPSPVFQSASVPGAATTIQVMVKDSKRYGATGGWGFGRFAGGKPTSEAEHETCFACHQSLAPEHDFVVTRFAP